VLDTIQPPGGGTPQWKILADDWKCTASEPVTGIHIWGSWLNDVLPQGIAGPDAGNVKFELSIHSDIAAVPGPNPQPSRPGDTLWSAILQPGDYTVRPYATVTGEQFFDPNTNAIIGKDSTVWQYNFTNLPNPIAQNNGTMYWLDVQAMPLDPTGLPDLTKTFGWKTTNPQETVHFGDDAVFADTNGFGGGLLNQWQPMVYPSSHPYAGQSIDLSFVITPEPGALVMLLGAGVMGLVVLARRRWGTKA